jgi:hypothetical protein
MFSLRAVAVWLNAVPHAGNFGVSVKDGGVSVIQGQARTAYIPRSPLVARREAAGRKRLAASGSLPKR